MRTLAIRAAILLLSVSLTLLYPAGCKTVVFDSSTGFFGLEDYGKCGFSGIEDELMYQGHVGKESISLGLDCQKITKKEIGSAALLCIMNPNRMLSWDEKELIWDYVSKGGELLLVCDNPRFVNNANILASIFGMRFEEEGFAGDLVTDVYGTEVRFTDPLNIEMDLGTYDGFRITGQNRTVFAGQDYGAGKVGLLADQSVLTNEYFEEHDTYFASTLIRWYLANLGISYSPKSMSVNSSLGDVVVMIVQNSGTIAQRLNISFTPNSGYTAISESDFTLNPGDKRPIKMVIRKVDEVGKFSGFVIVKRSYLFGSKEDYIPLEVK
jgi:hypothetical protein